MDFSFELERYKDSSSLHSKEKKLGEMEFSRGTYQVQIFDLKDQEDYWVFLHFDQYKLRDVFCSCHASCVMCGHSYVAIQSILDEKNCPLHLLFETSFWKILTWHCMLIFGSSVLDLKEKNRGEYVIFSEKESRQFTLKSKSVATQTFLEHILDPERWETDTTSIKFSNFSDEEIDLWRQGRPSEAMRYELSYWADLAKRIFLLEYWGKPYKPFFEKSVALPKTLGFSFEEVELVFPMTQSMWESVLPILNQDYFPLNIYQFHLGMIRSVDYNPHRMCFHLNYQGQDLWKDQMQVFLDNNAYAFGNFLYHPTLGFLNTSWDPLLSSFCIEKENMEAFLDRYGDTMGKNVSSVSIDSYEKKVHYDISFDAHWSLSLKAYVFHKGDLQKKGVQRFGKWVFMPQRGFLKLSDLVELEGALEKNIPQHQVGDFVTCHRFWLKQYPEFFIHLSSLESEISYWVDSSSLCFALTEDEDKTLESKEFGNWVYVKERGFFPKSVSRDLEIFPGLCVLKKEVSPFIEKHKESLESIRNFFSQDCPIQRAGIAIYYDVKGVIVIKPTFKFYPEFEKRPLCFFGDYIYLKGEGFSKIPFSNRLPKRYRKQVRIDPCEQGFFINYELEVLRPHILELDPCLKEPLELDLIIKDFKDLEGQRHVFCFELEYQSEKGRVNVLDLYRALKKGDHLFVCSAGLIDLRQGRFSWLTYLRQEQTFSDKYCILKRQDWYRLQAFETVKNLSELDSFFASKGFEQGLSYQDPDLSDLKGSLRGYQKIGVDWLWFLYQNGLSGLLCDDMGLGKTHMVMGLLAAIAKHICQKKGEKAKFLVICPTSVLYHWQEKLSFYLPDLSVSMFYGKGRCLEKWHKESGVLLSSYGISRRDVAILSPLQFHAAIFDEIHIAKNHHSQIYRVLEKIQAEMKVGMTGTPIENNLRELKALFDLMIPSYLPADTAYRQQFILPIERYGDSKQKHLLQALIKPFVLRRVKEEVLEDLPEKIEEKCYCDLSSEQEEVYQQIIVSLKQGIIRDLEDETAPISYVHIFSILSKLKQLCNHPALLAKDVTNYKGYSSGKWQLFVDLIQQVCESGQKVVIYSQYLSMLDIIEKHLEEQGLGFSSLRGGTQNRSKAMEQFSKDPHCFAFVASLHAAGVGIDLTAASVVIHYDRWWNLAKENQATDRVHRIGQNRGVQVFKLICKGTLEEKIDQIISKKSKLIDEVITKDDVSCAKQFNRQELLDILRYH